LFLLNVLIVISLYATKFGRHKKFASTAPECPPPPEATGLMQLLVQRNLRFNALFGRLQHRPPPTKTAV